MPTKNAVHLACCVATIAFAVAFVFPAFVPTPVLWYWPAERSWAFEVAARGIAMDFYGRCVVAAIASTLAAVATYAALRRFTHREPRARVVTLFTMWAIGFVLVAISFSVWRLAHRVPVPPPVPSWYQPR
jgi:hypothetical protein